jgi:hypothetical protein
MLEAKEHAMLSHMEKRHIGKDKIRKLLVQKVPRRK